MEKPSGGVKASLFLRGTTYSGIVGLAGGHLTFRSDGGNIALSVHAVYRVLTDGERKLEVLAAHFRYFFFLLPQGGARALAEQIERLQCVRPVCPNKSPVNVNSRGWNLYSHEAEYLRVFGPLLGTSQSLFRFTDANCQYQLCPSYPFLMVLPSQISDATLQGCAKYRSSGRFPALTWRHTNGATLSRCAQPLVGLGMSGGERSAADEAVINSLRVTGSAHTGKDQLLYIVDARPLINAHANKVKGGGTENVAWYRQCVLEQLDLVNIHKVRDAYDALHNVMANACKMETGYTDSIAPLSDDGRWLASLHESRWLTYVAHILKGAMRIASLIRDGNPVLVHCR